MTCDGLTIAGALLGAGLLDATVRPRAARGWAGLWLLACMSTALYGLFLAICGSGSMAMVLALAVQALLAVASNAKHAMLGEPLLFSDLALIGAVFRHPQFYLSAVAMWQRVAGGIVVAVLLVLVAWFSVADGAAHLTGLVLMAAGLGALALSLRLSPWRALARVPDADADTRRLGLLPVLLLYWLRWRAEPDPAPCAPVARQAAEEGPELIVVIQCESFADPVELFGDPALALPGLAAARASACRWGNLNVSGFGAYTMRTEYGVLFGRDEEALGFRRYDPFLTAVGEGSYALPARLAAQDGRWRSLFVHPHDMRFYGRDRIMPAGGFAQLVGEDRFAPPGPDEGRYVTDAAMTDAIMALADAARQPTLLYAVTIENHGPWESKGGESKGAGNKGGELVDGYMRLVRKGDAMLASLTQRIAALKRPALLVFFGDHRPSIPGATKPGGDRHTPYVMLRMDEEGRVLPGSNRRMDLTPAGLHHAILGEALGPQG